MRVCTIFLLTCLLFACGCGAQDPGQTSSAASSGGNAEKLPDLADMQLVMVIGQRDFRDEELFEPKALLEKAGAQVVVASSSLDEATGMLGGKAQPDMPLSDVNPEEFHAVVFIGGTGAREYWDDDTAHGLAREAAERGRIVAAICLAPVTLANAGLLDGKKATVWSTEADRLRAQGAEYTGAEVEVDGLLITGNGPEAAGEFAAAIAQALARMKEHSSG
jgi:protease I